MTPVQALQQALAGEHAAVYVYGVLGGRVSISEHPDLAAKLASAYDTHRARRDQLLGMIGATGAVPVGARLGYQLPNAARSAADAAASARVVESRCADVYADTVGSTSQRDRQWALDALTDAATRVMTFGGRPEAFPGAPEL